MLFIVRFTDDAAMLSVRTQYLAEHIDWLDANSSLILVAGSLRDEPDSDPIGATWIVDAPSRDDVIELIQTDPFWIHGLRQNVEIHFWSKAFPDRQSPV